MAAQDAWILDNANVVTLDAQAPRARAIAVAGGRITGVFVGAPPPGTPGVRLDLAGATVLPGLVDAHLHLGALGATARQLDLRGTRSLAEVIERVRATVAMTPPGQWVRGEGWDQNDWPEARYPTHAALDAAAPDHPVWLTRIDGHAVWLNGAALNLAGLGAASVDPAGGEIRRGAGGQPTGILIDTAIDLAATALPPPSATEIEADVREGLRRCAAVGLTAVHDMGTSAAELAALRRMAQAGELPLRVYAYVSGEVDLGGVVRDQGWLQIVGVKLYADGALGSHGAALRAPYADRPETSGLLIHAPPVLARRVQAAAADGRCVAIHAIGDRAVDVALAAILGLAEPRTCHRLEHLQVMGPADAARLAAAGVVASMQPTHATSDRPWVETRVGAARLRFAYAWQTLLAAGVPLAFGSDAPVESENPWLGVYAAVTRQDADGQPPGGWLPAERLTVDQALLAFTRGPRRAVGAEGGILAVGQPADLTLVDRDPLMISPGELPRLRPLGTMVGGTWTVAPTGVGVAP